MSQALSVFGLDAAGTSGEVAGDVAATRGGGSAD